MEINKKSRDIFIVSPVEKLREKDGEKILNHCYELLTSACEISKNRRFDNEQTLRGLYDKYHKDSEFFRKNPNAPLYLVSILNNLGIWYYNRKKYHYAEYIFRQCIIEYHVSILQYQNPPSLSHTPFDPLQSSTPLEFDTQHNKKEYIYLLYNLGNVLNQLSHFEEAESVYCACLHKLEALSIGQSSWNHKYDPDYLAVLSNLGLLYSHQSEYDQLAEYLFRECFTMRKELLSLIRCAKLKCESKIEEPTNPRPPSRQFSGRFSPGIFKTEHEDIIKSDQLYSLDGNIQVDKQILQQYQSLEREHTILWIHSGFNLCCFYIERNIYDKENIPEILQECLDKSKELWGERNEMMERILCVWNRMKMQKIQKRTNFFEVFWDQIYENLPSSNETSGGITLSNIFSEDSKRCHSFTQRKQFDEEWGDVVMNPKEWMETSIQPTTHSCSKWSDISKSFIKSDDEFE
jgi:hypothetical protein